MSNADFNLNADGTLELVNEIRFTRITSVNPKIVSKKYSLVEGNLTKTVSAHISAANVDQCCIRSISDFSQVLLDLSPSQCLVYGIAPVESRRLMSRKMQLKLDDPDTVITRSKKDFAWASGAGIMMLDYDVPINTTPLGRDELLGLLRTTCPCLADAEMLWWPSTSSCLFNGDTGKEVHGVRGQRLYVAVADASDIPRAGRILNLLLWARGYGHIAISKSGSILERPIFDESVWSACHIDFAAGAVCQPPLVQRRGVPLFIPGRLHFIDTAKALPDLDRETYEKASEHIYRLRLIKEGEAQRIRFAWTEARLPEMAKRINTRDHCSMPEADSMARNQVARAIDNSELCGDWYLSVLRQDGLQVRVPVGEVLDDPFAWHGCLTLDPIEPDYDGGRPVGKLYLVGSRPNLYSFAHGGHNYRLVRQLFRIEIVKGRMSDQVDQALSALRRSSNVFDHGTGLVLVSDTGQLLALDKDTLRYVLATNTQFWHRSGDGSEILDNPPLDVCAAIVKLKLERRLKPLDAIVNAPIMKPSGTVLMRAGYDAETRLCLVMSEEYGPVPDQPNRDELVAALDDLFAPFAGFPFATAVDRGVLLAGLLTSVQRPVLPTAPAFAFDAPRQGTGKTLVAECVGVIATGQRPVVWPHVSANEEEIRKRIMTALRGGTQVLVWDNVVGAFDSPSLAVLLTSANYTDRILGVSEAEQFPNRMLVLITGNNFTPSGELPRRVLTCRLDAQMERPYARRFDFDPVQYCHENRPDIVNAAMTLLAGYQAAGAPMMDSSPLGSFEHWDKMIRQPVLWIAQTVAKPGLFADPMISVTSQADEDPAEETMHSFLQALTRKCVTGVFTAKALSRVCHEVHRFGAHPSETDRDIAEALEEFTGRKDPSSKSVGKALKFRLNRIVGGLSLVKSGAAGNRTTHWRVAGADARDMEPAVKVSEFEDLSCDVEDLL